ncbi:MAG: flagellar basal body protein [Phycisphaerales bacterium]|jgi:flagellar basal-body rod protein FlgB|nr:flagellar basal body protein [Phycisphaerales bacterium]
MPTLEKVFLFAGQRQRIIANNIANIDTPGYQGRDVDPRAFQKMLGDAVESRRSKTGGSFGDLELDSNGQVEMRGSQMILNPQTPTEGVLFHDRNQRDLERLMQQLVENASTFRVASDLMRQNTAQLNLAIAQRVL